jgi:dsDNA-specific endonuclease/ATPase MutS2
MARRPGPGPDDIDADLLDGAAPELDAATPPLTDELDLHTFQPRDCADLVAEYLEAARDAGLPRVRIVHGKGTGALRRIVHDVLDGHPAVRSYQLAGEHGGGWGATVVELHPQSPPLAGS